MKVIVLGGAGDMGSRAVRDLADQPDVEMLTIADLNITAARELAREVGPRARAVQIDATRTDTMVDAIRGHDVAASAIGPFYRFERPVAEAALAADADYVSICDDYDGAAKVLELDNEARLKGRRILTGLGWTPGLSNVLAKKGADQLEKADEINVYWAGASADSSGFAVVLHTMHIFTGLVPSFDGDQPVVVRAGTGREVVKFPEPLGNVATFHLGHPEPLTLSRYIPGVRRVTLKGGLTEAFLNSLAIMMATLRMTNTARKKYVLGKAIKPILPALEKVGKPGVPMSGIRVDVKGWRDGKFIQLTYRAADHMNNLTGVPLAIGALMMGRGEIERTGAFAPEAPGAVDPDRFLAELAKRGTKYDFSEKELAARAG